VVSQVSPAIQAFLDTLGSPAFLDLAVQEFLVILGSPAFLDSAVQVSLDFLAHKAPVDFLGFQDILDFQE